MAGVKYTVTEEYDMLTIEGEPYCGRRRIVANIHEPNSDNPVVELKHALGLDGVKEILKLAQQHKHGGKFETHILWGDKIKGGPNKYEFNTPEEREAFLAAISEGDGWLSGEEVNPGDYINCECGEDSEPFHREEGQCDHCGQFYCTECGAKTEMAGDGWDGLCGNCADRADDEVAETDILEGRDVS